MSSSSQAPPDDPVDLLAWLYDRLDAALFESSPDLYELIYVEPQFIAAASEIEAAAVAGLDAVEVARRLTAEDRPDWLPLAYVIGLDRALALANPFVATGDPGALAAVEIRYLLTGVMNTPAIPGAVLPACADPGRPMLVAETPADLLSAVVRVPEAEWESAKHQRIPGHHDFDRDELDDGLVVACVPMLNHMDELECTPVPSSAGAAFYSIEPRGTRVLRDRAAVILDRLDRSGAMLAVLPELATTEALVSDWRRLIRTAAPPRSSRLRWIFVGSGHVTSGDPPPRNRGFLLSRRDGTILLLQDKRFGFSFSTKQLNEWGLAGRLGTEPLDEFIRRGTHFTFVESNVGRLVILICEDLGRVFDVGPAVRAFGTSHVLTPVFSKPTMGFYWEHQRAREYTAAVGATVIVSNSLAVARAMGMRQRMGAALVVSDDNWKLARATHAEDILLFTVTKTGQVAVHPVFRG
jgi:predicted amidohydrolase